MYATLVTSAGVVGMVALGGMSAVFHQNMEARAHGQRHHVTVEADANASASAGTAVSSASSVSSSALSSSSSSRMTHREWVRAHIQAIRRCQLFHGHEQGRCIKKVNADIRLGVQARMHGDVTIR